MNKILICFFLSSIFRFLNAETCLESDDSHPRAFVSHSPNLIVGFTQKCASTSLLITLLKNYGLYDQACNEGIYSFAEKLHFNNSMQKILEGNEYYKIKIVRNPFTRVVSSYINTCRFYGFIYSFETFLYILEHIDKPELVSKYLPDGCLQGLLNHCRFQYWKYDKYMDKIIRLENLQEGFNEINQLLGLNLTFEDSFYDHHNNYMPFNIYVGHISPKTFFKKNKWPSYYMFYNQKNMALVKKIYKIDFDAYSYEAPPELFNQIQKISKFTKRRNS